MGPSHERSIDRRSFLRTASVLIPLGVGFACAEPEPKASPNDSGVTAVLYRQIGCGCCATYAAYLRDHGYEVRVETVDDMEPVRQSYGLPAAAVGCHTTLIRDYVVEGHVPVVAIRRVLTERPDLDGISVSGMPLNSPGMGEPNGKPLTILSFKDGAVGEYMLIRTF